jgi:MoaA/NifB/PqqE/SkfB family radical SAM enzyme
MLASLDPAVLGCITVTTNGTVRIAAPATVLRQLGCLRVSIDGHTDEFQQELRGINVAPVLTTCAKLRSMQIAHTVRMTLYRRNVRRLEEMYAWVAANDIARLALFEYQPSGRGIGQDVIFGVSPEDIDHLLADLVRLPRPAGLDVLTLNLAQRRVDSVLACEDALVGAGLEVRRLRPTANITVNYNGAVGVSPWMVTAHGSPDVFTQALSPGFLDEIEEAASAGALQDDGPCLSKIQLWCGE